MSRSPDDSTPRSGKEPWYRNRTNSFPLSWVRLFLVGLVLWMASVLVTAVTGNFNMIPTAVLLGSFLVPVTAVVWYMDHYESPSVNVRHVFDALPIDRGRVVLASALDERCLIGDRPL